MNDDDAELERFDRIAAWITYIGAVLVIISIIIIIIAEGVRSVA